MSLSAAPHGQAGGIATGIRAEVPARFVARGHRTAFWAALWIAAAGAEALALKPVLDTEEPIQGLDVVFTLIGGSFAAFGLVAWRRRPDSHSGR